MLCYFFGMKLKSVRFIGFTLLGIIAFILLIYEGTTRFIDALSLSLGFVCIGALFSMIDLSGSGDGGTGFGSGCGSGCGGGCGGGE